jgi:hypothetical protein
MQRFKILAGAGGLIAAALVGGTLISSAFAAPVDDATSTDALASGPISDEYVETYLDTLAAELGVDRAALGPAAQAAANAAIDAAVAAGDLDAEDAEEAKARIAELEDPARLLVRGIGHGHRHGPGGVGFGLRLGEAVDAAAGALGMEDDDLVEAMRDGSSLSELAEQQAVDYATVSSAVLAAVQAEVDDAVADEDITQERADEIIANLNEWLEDGGEAGFGPGFGRRGFGPGN